METYHKIQSIFKRDPDNNYKTFLEGQWSVAAFGMLAGLQWQFTEKIDGTNIRIGWDDVTQQVTFGGRSDNAQLPGQLRIYMEEHFTPERMSSLEGPVTLIGEGFGGKIQRGSAYSPDQRFVLFDVFVEPSPEYPLGIWLNRKAVEETAFILGIPVVPVMFTSDLMTGYNSMRTWRPVSQVAEQPIVIEGVVARPCIELRDYLGHRVITKIKVKDFL